MKKKTSFVGDIQVDNITRKYLGTEPTWENQDELSDEQIKNKVLTAYTWYRYTLSSEDQKQIVYDYFKNQKKILQALKAAPSWLINPTLAALCRMNSRGLIFDKERQAFFDAGIASIVKEGNKIIAERKVSKKDTPVISIQQYMQKTANAHIAELEEVIDKYVNNIFNGESDDFEFSCYEWLNKRDVKPAIATKIAAYYRPQLEELEMAAIGGDDQIDEAYEHYSWEDVEQFRDFVANIISDCETLGVNVRKQKTPRKKKKVSVEKQVNKVKYLREDSNLKIASIDPTNIIGSQELWLFNTKYRQLHHYFAIDRAGLQIKGTTIKNFDEKTSQMKKIRKPEEFIPTVLSRGPKAIVKDFQTLKTKEVPCNGRINADTLILRVVK